VSQEIIELLGAVLRGTPSLPKALCKNESDLFDSELPDDIDEAIAICPSCPESVPCRAYAATEGLGALQMWPAPIASTARIHR
jgi:hypothetical protein